uniref:WAP domain-containing protein n=1 Tax=Malurus cyaneus samueli TaxID=2593467 RepID=A0A8C5TUY4_9PASS
MASAPARRSAACVAATMSACPHPKRNQAYARWLRMPRWPRPRVAPPAPGTGSARELRNAAAAATVATCAQPPNQVRRWPPEWRFHRECCQSSSVRDVGRCCRRAGTLIPGCTHRGTPRLQKRWCPQHRVVAPLAVSFCPSDKPGECPKVRPQQKSQPCTETDSCSHDRDCPRQEKCCFSGCAMRCTRPAREHPGECPRAQPCWDPRRRRGSQCVDDSVCRREEKCCDTGCGWECVAVPRDSGDRADEPCVEECLADSQCPRGQRCTSVGCGRACVDIPGGRVGVCPIPREGGTCLDLCNFDEECPWGYKCCSNGCGHVCTPASLQEHDTVAVPRHGAERCSEECEADSQCPWGQRCTRTSCGRICMNTPGGESQQTWVLPQEMWGIPAGWLLAGCSPLQAEMESAPCPGAVGAAWICAALMRSVPGATGAAAMAVAMSAHECLVMLCDGRAAPLQQDAFITGHGTVMGPSWPVSSPPLPAIKCVLGHP